MLREVASQLLGGLLLSVVIPTIAGREDSVARCIASYRETLRGLRYDLIVIQDAPSWGAACNMGFRKSEGDIVHFTADDLEAMPDWHAEAVSRLYDYDELPAPKVFNHSPDGQWDNIADGEDLALTHFTRIPIMTKSQYERIGPWPEDIYYADLWVSERARSIGIETRMVHSYSFVHYWSQVGRTDTPEMLAHSEARMNQLRSEGLQRCE